MRSNLKTKLYYRVKHSLPGRLRVAFPSLISHKRLIQSMQVYLSNGRGVTRVVINKYSSSITIYYDPKTTEEKDIFYMLDNFTWEKLAQLMGQVSKSNEEISAKKQPPKDVREGGVWKLAGKFFGGVGILGIFIPVLPALPLFFIAAFCQEKADGNTT